MRWQWGGWHRRSPGQDGDRASCAPFHLHQGASRNPGVEVARPAQFPVNTREDRSASVRLQDGYRPGRQIRLGALLEMEGELGVDEQIGVPVSTSRGSCDVHTPVEIVEPDFGTAPVAGLSPSGDDINGAVMLQRVLHSLVHNLLSQVGVGSDRHVRSPDDRIDCASTLWGIMPHICQRVKYFQLHEAYTGFVGLDSEPMDLTHQISLQSILLDGHMSSNHPEMGYLTTPCRQVS